MTFYILVGLLFLATPVLAIIALVKAVGNKGLIDDQTRRIAALEHQIATLRAAPPQFASVETTPTQAEQTMADPPSPDTQTAPPSAQSLASREATPVPEPPPIEGTVTSETPLLPTTPPTPTATKTGSVPASQPVLAKTPAKAEEPSQRERALAERWLVWLGGITLALGGTFFVKFGIDQGLLSPLVRICLGALVGILAMVAGSVLAKAPSLQTETPEAAPSKPDQSGALSAARHALPWHVPAALTGAGSAIVFASIYTGYALYDLLPPLTTFIALALTCAACCILALRHGPFVALLGLAGTYIVPALVATDTPSCMALFSYLLVVAAGGLTLLRWRSWWWLGWVIQGASAFWVITWYILQDSTASHQDATLGAFVCALFLLFVLFRRGIPSIPILKGVADSRQIRILVHSMGVLSSLLMVALVFWADTSTASYAGLFILHAGIIAFALRDPAFDRLPWSGALSTVLISLGWVLDAVPMDLLDNGLALPLPFHSTGLLWTMGLMVALHCISGFLAYRRTPHPGRWATLVSGMPVIALAASYYRLPYIFADLGWSMLALVVAAALVGCASHAARHREDKGIDLALAAYATGVVAALALMATFALEEAWLTVALAVLPLGIAWIDNYLRLPVLRKVALIVTGTVIARLVLNPWALDYPLTGSLTQAWVWYGYGLPALFFALASRIFLRRGDDRLVMVLEGGSVLFVTFLASEVIRLIATGGDFQNPYYGYLEQSWHSDVWLALSVGLLALHRRNGRKIPLWGGTALLVMGCGQTVLGPVLISNPLQTGMPVGSMPLLNGLLFAYAVPAILIGVATWLSPWEQRFRTVLYGLTMGLGVLWATMEVRHLFSGSLLTEFPVGQAEQGTYSVLYLLIGLGILLLGIHQRQAMLRKTALAVIIAVVAKVFLIDLSETDGLWRALSFLGLGATLVGLGVVYRRTLRHFPDSMPPSPPTENGE